MGTRPSSLIHIRRGGEAALALSQTAKDDRAELLGTAIASHCESEKFVHESNLPYGVSFRQPSDLSFADHMRRNAAAGTMPADSFASAPLTNLMTTGLRQSRLRHNFRLAR